MVTPGALKNFFSLLSKDESFLERTVSRFASTHPPSLDRMNKIKHSQIGAPQTLQALHLKETLAALNCAPE